MGFVLKGLYRTDVILYVRLNDMIKRAPDPLTSEEVNDILDAAIRNPRDYLILRVLARTGIRLGELYGVQKEGVWRGGIKKRDINFKAKRLWVYTLKKRKYARREVLLDEASIVLLRTKTLLMELDDFVFHDISYRQIQRLPLKYAHLAHIEKNVSPHSFRHFFITNMWRQGVDIVALQQLAGHRNIIGTAGYLHVATDDVEKKYREIYG